MAVVSGVLSGVGDVSEAVPWRGDVSPSVQIDGEFAGARVTFEVSEGERRVTPATERITHDNPVQFEAVEARFEKLNRPDRSALVLQAPGSTVTLWPAGEARQLVRLRVEALQSGSISYRWQFS